jgi:glycosyltransferase involved in cell wall biosynthesis
MRIAILTWESLHSAAVGGVAAHTSELSAALAEKGHQVHLFTRRMPNQSAHDVIDGVHYHRCSYAWHPDFVEEVNNMCRAMVDRFLEVEDLVGPFDIVHAHDWLCANAMIWIKQARQHKCVLTMHSTEYGRCGNAFANGRSVRVREQERAGTFWADKIIAVSQMTKDEVAWLYEVPQAKIDVISNGVHWERFDIDLDPGQEKRKYDIGPLDPTVLFCGRLVWQKGADILVEAIPAILNKYSNAKVVFAGDGDQRGFLEARARHLGVAHAVRFVGFTNGETLVRLFKLCETVCVPSRNEPFGIVVLEGWSAGKPVVATETGGPKEYVDHEVTGLKIFPRVDSVFWGIDRIFSNFDRARWMGSNGRKVLEKRFSWSKISAQTIETYEQLCPQPHVEPAEQEPLVASEPATPPRLKIVAMPVPPQEPRTSVKLEAKLIIPDNAINEETCMTFDSLKMYLNAYGFRATQRDHHLRIKGDWEDVTAALSEARKEILSKAKRRRLDERAGLRSTGCL